MLHRVGGQIKEWAGLVALFLVVAGGSAYAASTIGSEELIDNSVASVDLKNGDVRTADVRNDNLDGGGLSGVDVAADSLTGADINERTLKGISPGAFQRVGPATDADCSEVLEFCGPPGNSWLNFFESQESSQELADRTNPAGYRVDALGFIHLQGVVAGGDFAGGGIDSCFEPTQEIFFLPQELWPARDVVVPAVVGVTKRFGSTCSTVGPETALVEISDRGAVQLNDQGKESGYIDFLTLDGISFRAG